MPSASLSFGRVLHSQYPRLTRSSLLIALAFSADLLKPLHASLQHEGQNPDSQVLTPIDDLLVDGIRQEPVERQQQRVLAEEVEVVEAKKDENELPEDLRTLTVYPEPLMTDEQVRHGGFVLYVAGIMYAFMGISLVTQDYINPSIDIIKKKGVLSAESMNATLGAMVNSAAESFIIMNSIFFGVSDIGISTVVQQAAFYSFIIQSIFYLIVPAKTLIDWWIITRETVFILIYLVAISVFLFGNRVELYKALILFILYIVHIFLMKFSSKYEVAIKQALANRNEIKTLSNIAKNDITRFHMNLKSESISIEMLNKVHFTLRGEHIVFKDSLIRKKLRLSNSIKSGEEKYADKSDRTLMARKMWKEAVSMIIIKLQAYKHNLQIQRTQQCRQRLDKMLPLLDHKEVDDDEKIFGESYDSEDQSQESEHESEHGAIFHDDQSQDRNEYPKSPLARIDKVDAHGDPLKINESGMLSADCWRQGEDSKMEEFNQMYAQYMDHPIAQQPRPTIVYNMIMDKFYKGENKIAWPKSVRSKVGYILLIPLTHLQWFTIPNPMRNRNKERDESRENLYPVTLFMAMLWIWLYSGIIVWFSFDLTVACNWKFNVLPMVLYPFGIALRDYKKKVNLEQAMKEFQTKLADQKLSLAETFSAQIFQITGLMGLTWTLYISFAGVENVSFINESIQYQMPMLIVVVVVKYLLLACSNYRTSKTLFWLNLVCYIIFVAIIALIDYRIEIFGE